MKVLKRVIFGPAESERLTKISLVIFFPTLALVSFDQTLVIDSSSLEKHRAELVEVILLLLYELELML